MPWKHLVCNMRAIPSYDEETALAIALAISEDDVQFPRAGLSGTASTAASTAVENTAQNTTDNMDCERQLSQATSRRETLSDTSAGGTPLARQASQVLQDPALDLELGHRMQGAETRPHIPKQNSRDWTHQPHDSLEDRARLLSNLSVYGLLEREVKGDGSCQFRALSDQLFRTPHLHLEVRQVIVRQLRLRPELYQEFADEEYQYYVSEMSKPGVWGDHISLQAAADAYGVRIFIITSYEDSSVIEIKPNGGWRSERILYLSFWHEIHYGSVYPSAEPPRSLASDKLLGSRKLYNLFHGAAHNGRASTMGQTVS